MGGGQGFGEISSVEIGDREVNYSWTDLVILVTMLDAQLKIWGHDESHFMIYTLFEYYKEGQGSNLILSGILGTFETSVDEWDIPDNWSESEEVWEILNAEDEDLPLYVSVKEVASRVLLDWRFKILEKDVYKFFIGQWEEILGAWEKEDPDDDEIIKKFKLFIEMKKKGL